MMTQDGLNILKEIKEGLSISIKEEVLSWEMGTKIHVRLWFDDEVISEDSFVLDKVEEKS